MIQIFYEAVAWHLAPIGAAACDSGAGATQNECENAVAQLAARVGTTPGRSLQIGSGGTCNDAGWGSVPLGCTAMTAAPGDWAAHYKSSGADCGSGYQRVCSGQAQLHARILTETEANISPGLHPAIIKTALEHRQRIMNISTSPTHP